MEKVIDLAGYRLLRDALKGIKLIEDVATEPYLVPELSEVVDAVTKARIAVYRYNDHIIPQDSDEFDWYHGPGWYHEKFDAKSWRLVGDPMGPYASEETAIFAAYEHYKLGR